MIEAGLSVARCFLAINPHRKVPNENNSPLPLASTETRGSDTSYSIVFTDTGRMYVQESAILASLQEGTRKPTFSHRRFQTTL